MLKDIMVYKGSESKAFQLYSTKESSWTLPSDEVSKNECRGNAPISLMQSVAWLFLSFLIYIYSDREYQSKDSNK